MTWLHRYCRLLAVATLLLVTAGGMVTSTNSGLSVPDWPTTYGQNMFLFPFRRMVGGIFYEHGHRLIASTVGFLTIGLVILLWRLEPRRWVRNLGLVALGAVILQGVLGGLTVLFLLPDAISISHAGLAQLFFCLTVSLTLFTSRSWREPSASPTDDAGLRRRMTIMTSVVYGQILIGATMRHTGAGLAIPDFPLMFGRLIPDHWNAAIAVHFAHRVGALVVTLGIAGTAGYTWSQHRDRREMTRPALVLVVLIAVQVTLGALTVLSRRDPWINSFHVVCGAMVLTTSLVLTLRAWQSRLVRQTVQRADKAPIVVPGAAAPARGGA